MNRRLLLAVSIATLAVPAFAQQKPLGFAEAKAAFDKDKKVAEELDAQLFAAEPQVQNPTDIDIDARGRVWAVECVNYRKWGKLRAEGDRVVILADENGDGQAEAKTFYQSPELTNPLGICVLPQEKGTKVIVSAAPNVWLLTDADGDDKAEDAKVIFKTTGVWDYDHQIHAFVFGPDGKFYFNFGDAATSLTWPDGSKVKDVAGNEITNAGKPYRKGMVFRCDIDLATAKAGNVETLGWNFRNNYEVCVDSFGTMWQSDNDDDGNKGVRINYVMQFGNFGYTDEVTGAGWSAKRTNLEAEVPQRHWYQNDPGVVPNLIVTGAGSPTGILLNEGTLLGAKFTNQLIHCDAGPRTVRAYPVEKDGAGYKATMEDILTSADQWYRPSDVAIAPDGSLFIADWYDPGVGGHNMGDNNAASIRGRIYRVAPAGHKYAPKAADFSTAAACVEALKSPNLATRARAWAALDAMADKEAEPALQKLWASEDPRQRARAMPLLARLEGKTVDYLRAGIKDRDEDVRIATIRNGVVLAREGRFESAALETAPEAIQLIRDTPRVRRELLLALAGADGVEMYFSLLARQHDGKDRWYLEAIGIAARGNDDALLDAWLGTTNGQWNTPGGRDIVWRLRAKKCAELLGKIIADKATTAGEVPRYLRAFDFLPAGEEKTKALVALLKQPGDTATEAMKRLKGIDLSKNASVKTALDAMLAQTRGTAKFVELVREFGMKGQGRALMEFIVKDPASADAIDAAKLVLATEPEAFKKALDGADAAKIIDALGNTAGKEGATFLLPLATDAKRPLPQRQAVVRALARSQGGVGAMIAMAKEQKFPADLQLTAAQALGAVQMPKFKDDITAHFALPGNRDGKPLPPVAELAKMKGDAVRGKAVYERAEATCVTCHKVGATGSDFGPALGEIGGKLSREALIESIIAPNSGVSMGFETTQLSLKNGDAAQGIVRSDTAEELVLAMPGGAQNRFKKADVAKREKLATSMMPAGLQALLSTEDLVDLIEYLASLKAAKK